MAASAMAWAFSPSSSDGWIGHLSGPDESGSLRLSGFQASMRAAGLDPDRYQEPSRTSEEGGYAVTRRLLFQHGQAPRSARRPGAGSGDPDHRPLGLPASRWRRGRPSRPPGPLRGIRPQFRYWRCGAFMPTYHSYVDAVRKLDGFAGEK